VHFFLAGLKLLLQVGQFQFVGLGQFGGNGLLSLVRFAYGLGLDKVVHCFQSLVEDGESVL
jgi:hypothetical protein